MTTICVSIGTINGDRSIEPRDVLAERLRSLNALIILSERMDGIYSLYLR